MSQPKAHLDAIDLEAERQAKAISRGRMLGSGSCVNGKGKRINGGSGRSTAIPCSSGGGHSYARIRLHRVGAA